MLDSLQYLISLIADTLCTVDVPKPFIKPPAMTEVPVKKKKNNQMN